MFFSYFICNSVALNYFSVIQGTSTTLCSRQFYQFRILYYLLLSSVSCVSFENFWTNPSKGKFYMGKMKSSNVPKPKCLGRIVVTSLSDSIQQIYISVGLIQAARWDPNLTHFPKNYYQNFPSCALFDLVSDNLNGFKSSLWYKVTDLQGWMTSISPSLSRSHVLSSHLKHNSFSFKF